MRVLIYTPTYRLEPQTVSAVLGLQRSWAHGGCDWMIERDNPYSQEEDPRAHKNILHSYVKLRDIITRTDTYDLVCIIESDIIPPGHALEEMYQCLLAGADVAYGLYVFRYYEKDQKDIARRFGQRMANPLNITHRHTAEAGGCKNTGNSLTNDGMERELARAKAMRFYPCSGSGIGCVMMRADVIREVPFRLAAGPFTAHNDTYWNDDLWAKGYEQYAAMNVLCGHVDTDGEVLYPEL